MNISIIILTFNQKDLTIRCLDSLKDFRSNPEVEIILVDNGSTDETYKEVKNNFPWVKLISNDKNIGVAAGRNLGLKFAQGNLFMILDNDTIVSTSSILKLADFLNNHHDCGIVAPALLSPDNRVQKSFKDFPSIFQKTKNWISGKREDQFVNHLPEKPLQPFYVIGAAQMFPAWIFHKIGGFDENIFFGPEDADFCIKVRDLGKKVIYYPEVSIIHDWQRSTTGKIFNKRSFLHIKALLYFYWKYKRIK